MNLLLAEAATTGTSGGGMNTWVIIVYVVLIGAMMYFMIIKPQKKQRKEQAELMSRMEVGDSVMTTAGFYGVIIDMTDDTVIVEFGNNKNCRIPMQKQAIVQIEKPVDNG
ncbi:MAG: preprotein translocase subunit YajC [Lachnospiraceae bacterium]|jgi:preprotein translocase subunit YajC|nr:preprotein translocase subunit YajC [Lachnospiraceae bacterium]